MELRHLKYFLAVANTGNVTKAAEACFVAQSALSAQIGRLEADLGSPLFFRSTRGMRLTPAGEALRPLASRLLADAARIEEELAALRGVLAGRLRIGMIQGAPPHLQIVRLVAALHERHPSVDLEVRTGASEQLARDVANGVLDVAIVASPPSALPPSLTVTAVVDDPLVAIFPHGTALRGTRTVAVSELADHGSFIHYRRGSGLRRSVEAAFDRAGVDIVARFELDQVADMVDLVASGVGCTIVPASMLGSADSRPQYPVVTRALRDAKALHTISVVNHGAPAPTVAAFISLLLPDARRAPRRTS